MRTWVSQKSYTLALAAFRNTALNASIRSLRPTTVACLPPENSASERSAISTGLVRQPARATAKKFINERLAWWATSGGISSHRVVAMKWAKFCVTPNVGGIVILVLRAQTIIRRVQFVWSCLSRRAAVLTRSHASLPNA